MTAVWGLSGVNHGFDYDPDQIEADFCSQNYPSS
jgi:hypothetical protein